jgi:hypothetical protein
MGNVRFKISPQEFTRINNCYQHYLLMGNELYRIEKLDLEMVEQPARKKRRSGKIIEEAKKVRYITNAKIVSYNEKGRFLGYHTDANWIEMFLKDIRLMDFRYNWLNFVESLKAWGFEITFPPAIEEEEKTEDNGTEKDK